MRVIDLTDLKKKLITAVLKMNVFLPEDVKAAISSAYNNEEGPGKSLLSNILENIRIAETRKIPLCQDTGMVICFIEKGCDLTIPAGGLNGVISESIGEAYKSGYFRKSVVTDPINGRKNSGTNLPPVFYTDEVPGEKLKISLLAKGFGSENCSKIFMLKPTDDIKNVKDAVFSAVKDAGGSPCPPIILGIGIGGTMDYAAVLSKKALLRDIDKSNSDDYYASLERDILETVNTFGIGPGGLGGKTGCLGVNIEKYPTHIAGLPVAVSINCWADRKVTIEY